MTLNELYARIEAMKESAENLKQLATGSDHSALENYWIAYIEALDDVLLLMNKGE